MPTTASRDNVVAQREMSKGAAARAAEIYKFGNERVGKMYMPIDDIFVTNFNDYMDCQVLSNGKITPYYMTAIPANTPVIFLEKFCVVANSHYFINDYTGPLYKQSNDIIADCDEDWRPILCYKLLFKTQVVVYAHNAFYMNEKFIDFFKECKNDKV